MTTLDEKIAAFSWPASVPTSLDGAWAFLAANPFPREQFVLAETGASAEALDAAEEALGRPLPAVLRAALATHDGIQENWTHSGCVLASAAELAEEQEKFAGELESWETDVDLPVDRLIALGHEADGHTFYLLDTGRTAAGSAEDGPVVRRFDPEVAEALSESTVRWSSLGHFVSWLVCSAHTHPQKSPPDALLALFPYDGVPSEAVAGSDDEE